MSASKGYWFLLSGLLIGLALGLFYSRLMEPVEYYDVSPASLSEADKDQYRSMVALAYDANGDIGRARARVRLLGDAKTVWSLSAQAQRILAENGEPGAARSLAQLASVLGQESGVIATPTSTPAQMAVVERLPSATPQPDEDGDEATTDEAAEEIEDEQAEQDDDEEGVSTPTPEKDQPESKPTRQAAQISNPGLGIPFELTERERVCDSQVPEGTIQVIVQDEDGKSMPGVMIAVAWENGENQFYTGLYPEIDAGYADFQMQPGVLYSLRVGDSGETISELEAKTCEGEDEGAAGLLGGWKLRFIAQ